MKKIALDEVRYGQCHGVTPGPVGILVCKDNPLIGKRENPPVRQGAASDVARQVDKDSLSVIIPLSYMDIPLHATESVFQILPLLQRHTDRKGYEMLLDGRIHRGKKFSTEKGHDGPDRKEIPFLSRTHPPAAVKTALRNEAMDMGMEDHCLAPGMQRCDHARFTSDMSCIGKELTKRISYAGKKKIGHIPYVGKPEVVQFMGYGEDHMIMTAGEKPFFLSLKPLFYANPVTLRAHAITAGIIPLSVIVSFGACLNMAPKLGSTALYQRLCRFSDMKREPVGFLIVLICLFRYCLNRHDPLH